jgi:hypothetical protein
MSPENIQYLDQAPAGWFPLNVARAGDEGKWDWAVFMIDVPFDELKHCRCKTAWLFVHPKDYRPGRRVAHEAWVRVPGKHRNKDAAWEAALEMIETRQ